MSVAGKRVIVTGASSGLGAHCVRDLAAHGASVLAVARRTDRLVALAGAVMDVDGGFTLGVADADRINPG